MIAIKPVALALSKGWDDWGFVAHPKHGMTTKVPKEAQVFTDLESLQLAEDRWSKAGWRVENVHPVTLSDGRVVVTTNQKLDFSPSTCKTYSYLTLPSGECVQVNHHGHSQTWDCQPFSWGFGVSPQSPEALAIAKEVWKVAA